MSIVNLKGHPWKNKIEAYLDRLQSNYNINGIILFGSVASGRDNFKSDIDLLIISNDMGETWFDRHEAAYKQSEGGIQPFVVTSEEFKSAIENRQYIVWEALEKGIVLKSSELITEVKSKFVQLRKSNKLILREKGWSINL